MERLNAGGMMSTGRLVLLQEGSFRLVLAAITLAALERMELPPVGDATILPSPALLPELLTKLVQAGFMLAA